MATYLVIDVSKYQGKIDWKKVKASGVYGVIIRCAYRGYGLAGTIVTDPYFFEYVKGCNDNGIAWGVYFFSQAKNATEGIEEANYTLNLLNQVKPALPSFPVYIDSEYGNHGLGRADRISNASRTSALKAFCDTVEKAGYFSGIYASTTWFTCKLNDNELLKYSHWVADYRGYCGYKKSYSMWQYTSSGKVDGISGRVDMNKCYTDFPTIIKAKGLNGYGAKPVVKTFTVKLTGTDIDQFVNLAKALQIDDYTLE